MPYAGKNNGHVETRDIQLNENKKLRKLFCKEPRCKEPISRNLIVLRNLLFLVLMNVWKVGLKRKA